METITPDPDLLHGNDVWAKPAKQVIIAGPCSAESEEQMLKTAQGLKELKGVSIFRAGIWKPRTRLGSFQGMGTAGLEWLRTVKQETGLQTACEVSHKAQVAEALKYEVDILIIGAHTTVNSFLVQEIADELKGVKNPVIVKNPVNPDLNLWIGAIERFMQSGLTDIRAMHRGFSTLDNAPYRNHPKWEHVMALKNLLPALPLYCDVSHIAGKRSMLRPVSQRAIDLGYDGLMIESHYNPTVALSDGQQQLMPQEVNMLLQTLNLTGQHASQAITGAKLEDLRKHIEDLDDELLELMARRSKVTDRINGFTGVHRPEKETTNWDLTLQNIMLRASNGGMNKELVKTIFQEVRKQYARTHAYYDMGL